MDLCLATCCGDLFCYISNTTTSPQRQSHVTISSFLSPPGLREKRRGTKEVEGVFLPSCVCVMCACVCARLLTKFILTTSGPHAYFIIHQRRYKPQGLPFHRICRVVYENVIRQRSFHKKTETSGLGYLSIVTRVVAGRAKTREFDSQSGQQILLHGFRSCSGTPKLPPVGTCGGFYTAVSSVETNARGYECVELHPHVVHSFA